MSLATHIDKIQERARLAATACLAGDNTLARAHLGMIHDICEYAELVETVNGLSAPDPSAAAPAPAFVLGKQSDSRERPAPIQ